MYQVTSSQLALAKVPTKFWDLNPDTFSGSRASLTQVLSYIENLKCSDQWLVLHGGPCSGKTFLATFALKIALAAGIGGRYMSFQSEYSTFFSDEFVMQKRVRRWATTPVLVIDNVGPAENKGFVTALPRLVRPRSDNGRKTILVTSLEPQDFRANYGDIWETIDCLSLKVKCIASGKGGKTFTMSEEEDEITV